MRRVNYKPSRRHLLIISYLAVKVFLGHITTNKQTVTFRRLQEGDKNNMLASRFESRLMKAFFFILSLKNGVSWC
jgi:hypothetical protein